MIYPNHNKLMEYEDFKRSYGYVILLMEGKNMRKADGPGAKEINLEKHYEDYLEQQYKYNPDRGDCWECEGRARASCHFH